MYQRILLLYYFFVFFCNTLTCQTTRESDNSRLPGWAMPVQKKGLPNFYKVSDILYRGAQPTYEGIEELQKMGIKTIVNLRLNNSDKKMLKNKSFNYIQIPMKARLPKIEKYIKFYQIIIDTAQHPVFVHCLHGADRTGSSIAIYRMMQQNWSNEDALQEMIEGGYGFHTIFKRLKKFIEKFEKGKFLDNTELYITP